MKFLITENKMNSVSLSWLNEKYGNLIRSEEPSDIKYRTEEGRPIFMFDYKRKKNGSFYVYLSMEVWDFFKNFFGMSNGQSEAVFNVWLTERYGLSNIRVGFFSDDAYIADHINN